MKEASGELSMTLIVIVAAGIILAIFIGFRPTIEGWLKNMWGNFAKQGGATTFVQMPKVAIDGYEIILK